MFLPNWRNDKATQSQLDYIAHIQREAKMPLPPFTGSTKLEAAQWIDQYRFNGYHKSAAIKGEQT